MARDARQQMRDEAARQERDRAARAAHEERVRLTGEKRYLVRAKNGDLVSYSPEEYGVSRMAYGPAAITTVWGHMVFVGLQCVAVVVIAAALLGSYDGPHADPPPAIWLLPAAWLLLIAYSARNLRKEWRADRLRRERGLPTPAQ